MSTSTLDISRRSLLKYSAAAGAVGFFLAGCSQSGPDPSPAGVPVRGGTLRAGFTGGNAADTLDPGAALNNVDFARTFALYDPLIGLDAEGQSKLILAESIEPNADATSWTIRLRAGVLFHDGTPMSAEDVLFSLQRQVDNQFAAASALAPVDMGRAKVRDDLTLVLPCRQPYSILDQALSSNFYYLGIVPKTFDPDKPVGTGPFKLRTFSPGQESVFDANDDYWDGRPYVDSLVISNFLDETAQLNALQAGQVDLINQLSANSIVLAQSAGQVLIAEGGGMTPIVMRCDVAPFDDVRVRQALRLVVDRPQMNEVVFGSNSILGNDVFSIHDPSLDPDVPQRVQDIAQAKALLAAAGQSDLKVELVVADVSYGAVQTAEVFAQDAKAAGVTVDVKKIPVGEIFGSNFLSWDFCVSAWGYVEYLPMAATTTVKGSPLNETHFSNSHYDELFEQALLTVDPVEREALAQEMQRIDHEEGGYIIPTFAPTIDACGKNVHGATAAKTGIPFGNYDFRSLWIA